MIFKTDAELDKMNAPRLLAYYRSIRFSRPEYEQTEEDLEKYIAHVKVILDGKGHILRKVKSKNNVISKKGKK